MKRPKRFKHMISAIAYLTALNLACALTDIPIEILEHMESKMFGKTPQGIDSVCEVCFCVGSALGCLISVPICKKLGYPLTVCIFFAFSGLFSGLTIIPIHWSYMIIVRAFTGLFASTCFSVVPLLVAEEQSPEEREKTMMYFSVSMNLGIFITYVIHFGISFNYSYYYFIFILPILMSVSASILSYRTYKIMNIRARHLGRLSGGETSIEYDQIENKVHSDTFLSTADEETTTTFNIRAQNIKKQSQKKPKKSRLQHVSNLESIPENNVISNTDRPYQMSASDIDFLSGDVSSGNQYSVEVSVSSPQQFSMKLTRTQYIRMCYLACALGAMQMLTGVDAIAIYASDIFTGLFNKNAQTEVSVKNSKINFPIAQIQHNQDRNKIIKAVFLRRQLCTNPLLLTAPNPDMYGPLGAVILGAFNIVFTFVAATFVEKVKRRKLLLWGVLACSACNLTVSLLYVFNGPKIAVPVFLVLFNFAYAAGPEPGVFMLLSEVFPTKYKDKLNALAYTIDWIANIASVFLFGIFTEYHLEWASYLMFSLISLVLGITVVILVPETHKRELIDIEREIRSWTRKKRKTRVQNVKE